MARNHESVLNYWDKIGTPSDKHRWCCAIMKTAPLYRTLKIDGTNKQAKSLAFEGVRSEESVMRSNYERIGRGVARYVSGIVDAEDAIDEVFVVGRRGRDHLGGDQKRTGKGQEDA